MTLIYGRFLILLNLCIEIEIMIPELLAPAGSPEKLKYAFAYGADAVYAGIPKFSLRARGNGFRDASLKEAIETTHRMGKNFLSPLTFCPRTAKWSLLKNRWPFLQKQNQMHSSCPTLG